MRLRSPAAPLILVIARVRRRPSRWLPAVLGLALASAFACGVAGEATVAGAQGARSLIGSATPLDRSVRLIGPGPGSPGLGRAAERLFAELGMARPTRVVLLNPVRLSGLVVRPAAIDPLPAWLAGSDAARLGPCRPSGCPVVAAGSASLPAELRARGVRLQVIARVPLSSAVPLGFAPAAGGGAPVVLTGDPEGLNRITGLSGVYRTQSWVSVLDARRLPSWALAGFEARLQRAQVDAAAGAGLTVAAPFALLDRARAEARMAPDRLLLAGGGGLAALAGFLLLAGYALRHERGPDVRRLAAAGARTRDRLLFALGEAGALAGVGLLLGALLGALATAWLADGAGLPAGQVLQRSLLTPTGLALLPAGWALATGGLALVLLLPAARFADGLALAAAAALALTLTRGPAAGGPLPALLAPLACLAAGVVVYRIAAILLRGGERLARDGPLPLRLALVGLARAPTAPALAIAFVALSTGLGGFAVAYRETLLRAESDAAADRVPLDALIAPSASFLTPLELASPARWRSLAGGPVLPVRRTYASYLSGGAAVTVPALGVPAAGLTLIRGWRSSDGSASLAALARRLRPAGPLRTPGVRLIPGSRRLSLVVSAQGGDAILSAALGNSGSGLRTERLGVAGARRRRLSIALAPGDVELEALILNAPTGLEATAGHQNAENPAAATQAANTVRLGPITVSGGPRRLRVSLAGWRAAGAATAALTKPPAESTRGAGLLRVRFSVSGNPGVIRPLEPSDYRPVPFLADPATAAAAGPGGRVALTVDGLPVKGRVVGVLRRFPTLPAGSAGWLVADEPTLAAALDAELPGQGRPDELWIDAPRSGALRAGLARPPLSSLSSSFQTATLAGLRSDPVSHGVLGTLIAAAVAAGGLAVLGLVVALTGTLRDRRFERELAAQGLGRRALRRELAVRLVSALVLGLIMGTGVAIALSRLAVAAVQTAVSLTPPGPPVVAVTPWGALAGGVGAGLAALAGVSWLATRDLPRRPARGTAPEANSGGPR